MKNWKKDRLAKYSHKTSSFPVGVNMDYAWGILLDIALFFLEKAKKSNNSSERRNYIWSCILFCNAAVESFINREISISLNKNKSLEPEIKEHVKSLKSLKKKLTIVLKLNRGLPISLDKNNKGKEFYELDKNNKGKEFYEKVILLRNKIVHMNEKTYSEMNRLGQKIKTGEETIRKTIEFIEYIYSILKEEEPITLKQKLDRLDKIINEDQEGGA